SLALVGVIAVAAAWAAPTPPAPPSLAARLSKQINYMGVEDPKASLADALDMLAKTHDIQFDINEKAFALVSMKHVQRTEVVSATPSGPMKSQLGTVLRKVLSRVPVPSGATYAIRDDHIEITTGATLASEVWGDFKGPHLPLVWATLEKIQIEDALRELA